PLSKLARRKRRHAIVQFSKLLEINVRDDVCTNTEDLGEFDETWSKRGNRCGQPSRALPMSFVREESRRSNENPASPIAKEREQKRREPIPHDENTDDHGEGHQ